MKYIIRLIVMLLVKTSPWHFLIASIREIGWDIVIEKDRDEVEGLIIGGDSYIDRHIPQEDKHG